MTLKTIPPAEYVGLLECPTCGGCLGAEPGGPSVLCESCDERFPISAQGILELVEPEALNSETRRELRGNTYSTEVERRAAVIAENAIIWDSYYWRQRRRTIKRLARYLEGVELSRVFLLATGTGRDLLFLQRLLPLETVYCSDLSVTALQLLLERLDETNLRVGLFTSNLEACPVASQEIPVLVVGALHHTQDIHRSLEGLLARGYENLFLVEPIDNRLMRWLARRGVARRIEYSGVKPGRLALPRVRDLARRYGYELEVSTSWAFPEDYYRRIFPDRRWVQRGFFSLLSLLTRVSRPVKLGNRAVIHLRRRA